VLLFFWLCLNAPIARQQRASIRASAKADKVKPQIGFMASNLQLLKDDLRPAAARALGLRDAPKVTHIAPASPASAAGFRKGDVLKTLNGWEVPTGENATKFFSEKLTQLGASETAIFTVERAGRSKLSR
jgi:S1-C subfamily serine protease